MNDFGDVTLACDDDKRIQAHKRSVLSTTGSVGILGIFGHWFSWLLVDSRFGWSYYNWFSWNLRYIWPLAQLAPS